MSSTYSPCIGFCSTTYGDDYCRGCYRHIREVLDWRQLSSLEKSFYYQKIADLAAVYMKDKVDIHDLEQFQKICQQKSIPLIE